MNGRFLKAEATLINEKLKFESKVAQRDPVIVDYVPPAGDGQGITSLELLLMSLATCFGSSLKVLLSGPMQRRVQSLRLWAEGERRQTHPTVFESIALHVVVVADGLQETDLPPLLAKAEQICPVYAMLRRSVPIDLHCSLGEFIAPATTDLEKRADV